MYSTSPSYRPNWIEYLNNKRKIEENKRAAEDIDEAIYGEVKTKYKPPVTKRVDAYPKMTTAEEETARKEQK